MLDNTNNLYYTYFMETEAQRLARLARLQKAMEYPVYADVSSRKKWETFMGLPHKKPAKAKPSPAPRQIECDILDF